MKILQVVHGFPPRSPGGGETYTRNLSLALRERGHEVLVWSKLAAAERAEYSESDEIVDGLPVHHIVFNFKSVRGFEGYYRNTTVEDLFVRYVEQIKPDVIHFQHVAGLSATLIERAQRAGWPHALALHDYWYMCPTFHRLKPGLVHCPGTHQPVNCFECLAPPTPPQHAPRIAIHTANPIYQAARRVMPYRTRRALLDVYDILRGARLPIPTLVESNLLPTQDPAVRAPIQARTDYMRRLLDGCPLIIAPCEYVKRAHVEFGAAPERIRVVPWGIDLSHWAERPPARQYEKIRRIGMIGGIFEHKGVHVLVEAFRQLANPDLCLRISGHASDNSAYMVRVRQLAGDDPRIEFGGAYRQEELPAILRDLDVLVIPSLAQETYSFVAREAIWAGVPIIAATVGALPEAVTDCENGFLVPPGDVGALRERLEALLYDPSLATHQSKQQRLRHVESMPEHAAAMETLYGEIRRR